MATSTPPSIWPTGASVACGEPALAFSAKDESRLQAFTAQVAVSLENAQLFDEVLSHAARADICKKLLVMKDIQEFERGGANQRATAERSAMQSGRNAGCNRFGGENRAEWQAGSERLGYQHDIGPG